MTAMIDRPPDGDVCVAVPAQFAIAPHVLAAARTWITNVELEGTNAVSYYRCAPCGQSYAVASSKGRAYDYTPDELGALLMAHLMQRHGWTRETIGDR